MRTTPVFIAMALCFAATAAVAQEPAASIRGYVTDKDTGEPLTCVTLYADDLEHGIEHAATTGLDGYYVFEGLSVDVGGAPDGRYFIEVHAPGYRHYDPEHPDDTWSHPPIICPDGCAVGIDPVTLVLDLDILMAAVSDDPSTTVKGRVVDEDTDEGLAGVLVEAFNPEPVGATYTCLDGRFEIRDLPASKVAGDITLQFSAPNYATQTIAAPPPGEEAEVSLAKSVVLPATITGTVVRKNGGSPIEGAKVVAQHTQGVLGITTSTDATGLYAVVGVEDDAEYSVQATASGFSTASERQRIALGSDSLRVDFELESAAEGEGEGEGPPPPGCFGGSTHANGGGPGAALLVGCGMFGALVFARRKARNQVKTAS